MLIMSYCIDSNILINIKLKQKLLNTVYLSILYKLKKKKPK